MVIEGGCVSADQEADLANLKVNIGGDSNGGDGNRGCISGDQEADLANLGGDNNVV